MLQLQNSSFLHKSQIFFESFPYDARQLLFRLQLGGFFLFGSFFLGVFFFLSLEILIALSAFNTHKGEGGTLTCLQIQVFSSLPKPSRVN